MQQHADPWTTGLIAAAALASAATWTVLLTKLSQGKPILEHVPRRPVPWGAVGGVLALLFASLSVFQFLTSPQEPHFDGKTQIEIVGSILAFAVQMTTLTAAALFVIAIFSGARRDDLGVPQYAHEMARDVQLGVVAWLAALLPVFGLQMLMVTVLGQPTQHPLIQQLLRESTPALFLAALLSAVLVAPICEEIAFRLLLQGWLEKWVPTSQPSPEAHDDAVDLPLAIGKSHFVPIVISSLVFALAHLGYGPDPVALFVLALILGYTYQRTHRIVPCIVCHLLFNLYSLVLLALTIMRAGAAEPLETWPLPN